MVYSIVVSKKCLVGQNTKKIFVQDYGFFESGEKFDSNPVLISKEFPQFEILEVNDFQIHANHLNERETDFFIFSSRHSSEKGVSSFTVHPIGNWGKAELGGKDKTLVPSSASLNKKLILTLNKKVKEKNIDLPVISEVVHHGPFLIKPSVYVEIGSSEKEWLNKDYGKILVETILNFNNENQKKFQTAIGFGGTHYCHEFTKILLNTDIALSYIFPKHSIDFIDFEMFNQAIDKSVEKVDFILLDWKGLNSAHKEKIVSFCNKAGIDSKKVKVLL